MQRFHKQKVNMHRNVQLYVGQSRFENATLYLTAVATP